jgi:hypothetical protein
MMKPSPSVTAEVPSGSMSSGSNSRLSRPGTASRASAQEAGNPKASANTTVAAA